MALDEFNGVVWETDCVYGEFLGGVVFIIPLILRIDLKVLATGVPGEKWLDVL